MSDPFFRAVAYTEPLLAFARAIHALVYEAAVDLGPRGLFVRQADAAHVALVEATLGPMAFQGLGIQPVADGADAADVVAKATTTLGVDIDSLTAALTYARRRRSATVALELRSPSRQGDSHPSLSVAAAGVSRRVMTMSSDASTGVARSKTLDVPFGNGSATLSTDTRPLRLFLHEAKGLSDAVCLRCHLPKENVPADVVLTSPPVNDVLLEGETVSLATSEGISVDTKGDAHSHYPADYLRNILCAAPGARVKLRFASDYPVLVESDITRHVKLDAPGGGFVERDAVVGHVIFALAPRFDTSADEDHPEAR